MQDSSTVSTRPQLSGFIVTKHMGDCYKTSSSNRELNELKFGDLGSHKASGCGRTVRTELHLTATRASWEIHIPKLTLHALILDWTAPNKVEGTQIPSIAIHLPRGIKLDTLNANQHMKTRYLLAHPSSMESPAFTERPVQQEAGTGKSQSRPQPRVEECEEPARNEAA